MGIMAKDNEGKGVAITRAHVAMAILEIMIIDMRIKTEVQAAVNLKESFQTIEEEVKITRFEGDEDNGMVMNQTVTGTVETTILTVKIIHTEVTDGKVIEVKVMVTGEEGENGIQTHNITNRAIYHNPNFLILITTDHRQWATNTSTQYRTTHILCTHNQTRSIHHQDCQHNHTKQKHLSIVPKSGTL